MYYPSLFPTVRPFDPRPTSIGGPLEVPVLGTNRERENPLDLSVKTVRQTADSTADAEELMMLDHRKLAASHSLSAMGRLLAPSSVAGPTLLDPSLFRLAYTTDANACSHAAAAGLIPGLGNPFCLDTRTAVTTAPPSLGNHPMMNNFLQQQRDRCLDQHQAMYARTGSQHVSFLDPAHNSLPLHLRGAGGGLTQREAAALSNRNLYGGSLPTPMALPAFSLYPDEKGAFTSLRSSDKPFLTAGGLDTSRFTEHLQRLREQHLHQAAKCTGACCAPLSSLSQQHNVPCACCLQNPSQAALCSRSAVGCLGGKEPTPNKMCGGICDYLTPGLTLLPRPTASDIRLPLLPYCTGLTADSARQQQEQQTSSLFQSSPSLWNAGLQTGSKTAFSVPKKKEASKECQKENSKMLKESMEKEQRNSPVIKRPLIKSEVRKEEKEVIVIEEDVTIARHPPYKTEDVTIARHPPYKTDPGHDHMQQPKHDHAHHHQSHEHMQHPNCLPVPPRETEAQVHTSKMPLLEAVKPSEGASEAPVSVASPHGPPPLIAAVKGPTKPCVQPERESVPLPPAGLSAQSSHRTDSPTQVPSLHQPLGVQSIASVNRMVPREESMKQVAARPEIISHLPFPHFSSHEVKYIPPQPPSLPHNSLPERDDKTVLQKLLAARPPECAPVTSFPPNSGHLTDASSGSVLPSKLDIDRDTKQIKKRSMLECLASSDGFVAEKKRSKTTDLYADPSQLGREERALQRAMHHFEELEKLNQKVRPTSAQKPKLVEHIEEKKTSESIVQKQIECTVNVEKEEEETEALSNSYKHLSISKKYFKNTSYDTIRRDGKVTGIRAKKQIRKRLLARLYSKDEDLQENDGTEKSEFQEVSALSRNRKLLSQLTLTWRHRRLLYSCHAVRRRRLRSGLDMIARHKRKKPVSYVMVERGPSPITDTDDNALKVSVDGHIIPPEMKRLMVNKALGETILHRASRLGYPEVVIYCLETNYCDVNSRDNAGYTPLHECCSRGHLDIARALLQYGADVNASAAGGIRPLHDAVENNHVEVVRLLLSYGADATLATYSGLVPLTLSRSPIMAEFLQGFLADISGESDSRPPLPWRFRGSAGCLDPADSGYDVLDGVPSDPEGEGEGDDDFLFEVSDSPHLPTFRLQLPAAGSKAMCNFLRLTDVLRKMDLTYEEFRARHKHVDIIPMPRHEFEAYATCSQLLTGSKLDTLLAPGYCPTAGTTVELVRLDNRIRDILGIETVTVR